MTRLSYANTFALAWQAVSPQGNGLEGTLPRREIIISHDCILHRGLTANMLAFEGDSHVEWFEGNFEDYEKDKIRRLGENALTPKRIHFKPLGR